MTARRWALGTVVGVALAIGPGWVVGQAPVKPAAVVNGEPITAVDLEIVFKGSAKALPPPADGKADEVRRTLLYQMIDDLLLVQFLRQKGPRIDPTEVDKKVAELVAGLKTQGKTLRDFARESCESEAEIKKDLASILQWQAYAKERMTDEAVKHYYEENKEFFDGTTVRASHVVLRVPPSASDAERKKARAKLLALREELVGGKLEFAEAARMYSQCPSAPTGGDLGFFPRKGVVAEPFARAAFALPVGKVSDLIESEYGLHLIKVTERKPGQPSDFTKITEQVQETYKWDLRQDLVTRMRKKAKIEINLP